MENSGVGGMAELGRGEVYGDKGFSMSLLLGFP